MDTKKQTKTKQAQGHTPGSLYAVRMNPSGDLLITDEKDRVIASVWKAEFAPLLAAAPELNDVLGLLETAARRYALGDDLDSAYLLRLCERAKITIARAEGR